jgi:predicted ribosome quality control (RQC) complex YloA/Tae2 family protein
MPRRYISPAGLEVLVGLDAAENEKLSLRVARSHDLWFHAHDCPGAHVVLRVPKGGRASKDDIQWAAGVAAWYSKQKGPGRIKVMCATGSDIFQGPPKSARGTVTCLSNDVISVRCVIPT